MSREPLTASLESIRRLVVTKQHLAGKLPFKVTTQAILAVVRDLAYVQWDPISIVAPSHIISLWSRLGDFRLTVLERLLWEEKTLFQHPTPIAWIVLTEDYPLYLSLMRRYPDSLSSSWGAQKAKAKKFLAEHSDLRKKILNELRKGPLHLGEFEDHLRTKRSDGEWTCGSDVSLMLFHLTMSGEVMVVGHQGNQNLWGLSKEFLPSWVERKELPEEEVERQAAQRAIRALGAATPGEINYYFVRGRYQNLRRTLATLERESAIHRLVVEGLSTRDERYIHEQDVALLESLRADRFQPRMSLLSPFDNLIYSQARTSRLFGFDYVREQFLPKEKRKFGTYVLPILWGDKLIGRIDPRMDSEGGKLVINAVHAEPGAPGDREVAAEIGRTIFRFAEFLGARQVTFTSQVPEIWRSSLR
jgi:uncharacterized protein